MRVVTVAVLYMLVASSAMAQVTVGQRARLTRFSPCLDREHQFRCPLAPVRGVVAALAGDTIVVRLAHTHRTLVGRLVYGSFPDTSYLWQPGAPVALEVQTGVHSRGAGAWRGFRAGAVAGGVYGLALSTGLLIICAGPGRNDCDHTDVWLFAIGTPVVTSLTVGAVAGIVGYVASKREWTEVGPPQLHRSAIVGVALRF